MDYNITLEQEVIREILEKKKRKIEVDEAETISRLGGYTGEMPKEIKNILRRYIDCEITAKERDNLTNEYIKNKYPKYIPSEDDWMANKKIKEDPYLYPETEVLKNKLEIKNNDDLARIELILVNNKLLNIKNKDFGKIDEDYVNRIHKYLFNEIYHFAGENRIIEIYKSEKELGGDSFRYTEPHNIAKELKEVCDFYGKLKVSEFKEDKVKSVSKFAAKVWAIHSFREGNTRTVMCVAQDYAKKLGLEFNAEPIKENPMKFRDALLLHSLGEYAEPEKLRNIIKKCVDSGTAKAKEISISKKIQTKEKIKVKASKTLYNWKNKDSENER